MSIPESTTERGKCVVCGAPVTKRPDRNKTCSPECKAELCGRNARGTEWPSCRVHYGECAWCGHVVANARLARARFCCPSHHTAYANWTRNGRSFSSLVLIECRKCGEIVVKHHGRQSHCASCDSGYQVCDGGRECRRCGAGFFAEYTGGKRREYCVDCVDLHYKELRRTHSRIRRVRKRGVRGRHFTVKDKMRQHARQHGRCFWMVSDACIERAGKLPHASRTSEYHADHVVPLALQEYGAHDGAENMVVSCHECNEMKSATHPMDFAGLMF